MMIKDVLITELGVMEAPGGCVMHAMKGTSIGYKGFGEAYFSQIDSGAIKAWKRHREMTLNLIVPSGKIRFVLFDDRDGKARFQEIVISRSNYCRLTVPPMVWIGFQGLSENKSILLNIANIEHNVDEVDRREIEKIQYEWSVVS